MGGVGSLQKPEARSMNIRGALRGTPGSAYPESEPNATELPTCAPISKHRQLCTDSGGSGVARRARVALVCTPGAMMCLIRWVVKHAPSLIAPDSRCLSGVSRCSLSCTRPTPCVFRILSTWMKFADCGLRWAVCSADCHFWFWVGVNCALANKHLAFTRPYGPNRDNSKHSTSSGRFNSDFLRPPAFAYCHSNRAPHAGHQKTRTLAYLQS